MGKANFAFHGIKAWIKSTEAYKVINIYVESVREDGDRSTDIKKIHRIKSFSCFSKICQKCYMRNYYTDKYQHLLEFGSVVIKLQRCEHPNSLQFKV